jgi:hypothetical protein
MDLPLLVFLSPPELVDCTKMYLFYLGFIIEVKKMVITAQHCYL